MLSPIFYVSAALALSLFVNFIQYADKKNVKEEWQKATAEAKRYKGILYSIKHRKKQGFSNKVNNVDNRLK